MTPDVVVASGISVDGCLVSSVDKRRVFRSGHPERPCGGLSRCRDGRRHHQEIRFIGAVRLWRTVRDPQGEQSPRVERSGTGFRIRRYLLGALSSQ